MRVGVHSHERAVQLGLVRLPVEHDQLAVQAVERAQAEVTVLQDLPDRHVAVVSARQQRLHGRRLKQLVLGPLGAQLAVAQQLDPQRTKELDLAHRLATLLDHHDRRR